MRRRLENLLAPLGVLLVVGLVVAMLAWRPTAEGPDAGEEGAPDAADPGETSSEPAEPAPSEVTPTRDPERRGERRLPRERPIEPDLPNPSCPDVQRTRQLDVLTFNIKAGRGQGRYDLPLIAREIAAWDVDVVLLQEVDRFQRRSRGQDQPAALASALGFEWSFGTNVRRGGAAQYGTAILSRYPIVSSANTLLPNRRGMQQRGLLRATIQVDDREVSIYNTHLQHGRRAASMRGEQVRALMRVVEPDPNPTILGGDFNTGPRTPPMQTATGGRMTDSWPVVGAGPGHTVPAQGAKARIDYLLHSADLAPSEAQVFVSGIADHRAVRVGYRLPTQEACLPPGSVEGS